MGGSNSCFFKKAWTIVGEEVTNIMLKFFETQDMYMPINCIAVTLVPKVNNPSYVKEFIPIFCYTTIYKII